MENVIYNEPIRRGYSVDVGAVEMFATVNGKRCRKRYEVDFVVNRFDQRFYIQSAWDFPANEKREQETFSLRHIGDNFRKVVVTGNPYEKPWTDRNGVTFRSTTADCFARTRKTHRPLLITQNGRAASVVLDVADFQKMRESFELWDDLRSAEAELDAGRGIPHAQVMSELDDELQDLREEMGL